MPLVVEVQVNEWDPVEGKRVARRRMVRFAHVHSMEELKNWLETRALRARFERRMEAEEREMMEDSVGITKEGIHAAYRETVQMKERAFGGGESTGARKSLRECRGHITVDREGNWNDNL